MQRFTARGFGVRGRGLLVPVAAGIIAGLVFVSTGLRPPDLKSHPGTAPAPSADGLSGETWRLPGANGSRPVHELVVPLGRRAVSVPILEYHYIRVNPNRRDRMGFLLSVTPSDFSGQMRWLGEHGYHPVTFDDLRAYFSGLRPLPSRPVVLTFDDGYADFFTTAEPILGKYGFKAVAYVVPGFWGRKDYMSPAQVLELDRSGNVEIGSHTVHHLDIAQMSAGARAFELLRSSQMLQQLLGHKVVDFCYPSGEFGNGAAGAASVFYSTATTEVPGTELAWPERLVWPRVRVNGGESLAAFVAGLGAPEAVAMETFAASAAPPE